MKLKHIPLGALVLLMGCATTSPKMNQLTSVEEQAGLQQFQGQGMIKFRNIKLRPLGH